MDKKLWHLEEFNVLQATSDEEKETLMRISVQKHYQDGDIIRLPEEDRDNIYFLKKGRVKLSYFSDEGDEMILDIIPAGEIFGTFNQPIDIQEQISAIAPTVLCIFRRRDWDAFVEKHPRLQLEVSKILEGRIYRLVRKLQGLYFKNAHQRIREMIKDLAELHGRKIGTGFQTEIALKLTHEDLGKLAAVSRQTLSTILKQLEREGVIRYDRNRILVDNEKILIHSQRKL